MHVNRSRFLLWNWIAKHSSTKTVDEVSDAMLHVCGGTGYKVRNSLYYCLSVFNY